MAQKIFEAVNIVGSNFIDSRGKIFSSFQIVRFRISTFCLWANFGQIFVLFFAPSNFFPIKMKKNLNLCIKIRFNWIFVWIKLALEFFPKVTVFSLLNRFRGGKTFHSLGCNYPLRIAASLPITPLKLAFRVKTERRNKWQTWIRFVTIIKFTRAQFFCLNATKS